VTFEIHNESWVQSSQLYRDRILLFLTALSLQSIDNGVINHSLNNRLIKIYEQLFIMIITSVLMHRQVSEEHINIFNNSINNSKTAKHMHKVISHGKRHSVHSFRFSNVTDFEKK
jgi:hypothetical protein